MTQRGMPRDEVVSNLAIARDPVERPTLDAEHVLHLCCRQRLPQGFPTIPRSAALHPPQRPPRRAPGWCERCRQRRGEAVHHQTYIRLFRERLDDLVHPCGRCHGTSTVAPTTNRPGWALVRPAGSGSWIEPVAGRSLFLLPQALWRPRRARRTGRKRRVAAIAQSSRRLAKSWLHLRTATKGHIPSSGPRLCRCCWRCASRSRSRTGCASRAASWRRFNSFSTIGRICSYALDLRRSHRPSEISAFRSRTPCFSNVFAAIRYCRSGQRSFGARASIGRLAASVDRRYGR